MTSRSEDEPLHPKTGESGFSDTSTAPSPDLPNMQKRPHNFVVDPSGVPYKLLDGTTVRDFRFDDPTFLDNVLGGCMCLYFGVLWMVSGLFPFYLFLRILCIPTPYFNSWDFGASFIVFYLSLCLIFYLKDLWVPLGQPTPCKKSPLDLPTLDDLKVFDRLRYQFLAQSKRFSLAGSGVFIEEYDSIRDPGAKTLICCHPHGMISLAPFGLTYLRELNNYNMIGAPALVHWAPLFRLTFSGGFVKMNSADRVAFLSAMSAGRGLILVPGGLQEATIHEFGKEKVYLKKRRGFVACALSHGYELRPMYGFGESLTFDQIAPTFLLSLKFWLNQKGICTVFPVGNPYFGPIMMPRRAPLLLVVGKPIRLPKIEQPTPQDVEKYHTLYIEELSRIYLAYADQYYRFVKDKYGIVAPLPSSEDLQRSLARPSFAPPLQLF